MSLNKRDHEQILSSICDRCELVLIPLFAHSLRSLLDMRALEEGLFAFFVVGLFFNIFLYSIQMKMGFFSFSAVEFEGFKVTFKSYFKKLLIKSYFEKYFQEVILKNYNNCKNIHFCSFFCKFSSYILEN